MSPSTFLVKDFRSRFVERLDNGARNWKFSSSDFRKRNFRKDYLEAYEDMIRNTTTQYTPWYVVPADNKWFTRIVVAAVIIDAPASLNLQYPKVSAAKCEELASAKEALLAGA